MVLLLVGPPDGCFYGSTGDDIGTTNLHRQGRKGRYGRLSAVPVLQFPGPVRRQIGQTPLAVNEVNGPTTAL